MGENKTLEEAVELMLLHCAMPRDGLNINGKDHEGPLAIIPGEIYESVKRAFKARKAQ